MTLMMEYDKAIASGSIRDSNTQRDVVFALDAIADTLMHSERTWFWPWRKTLVKGLYIHGTVGAGKTYVMDLFYRYLEHTPKARYHFHHFMQYIDSELRRLQGTRDPLRTIVRAFAKSARVLCLDEFLVHDVADAMILGELLQGLLAQGVVLIATANTCPDDLYLHGVHRERFLPAIACIKQACRVMMLASQQDYRLGRKPLLQAYLSPLNEASHQALVQQFNALSASVVSEEGSTLTVQNRTVACVKVSARVVWFAFDVICSMPRSQLDYLEIATRFDTVLVSDIPAIQYDDTIHALLLIHFVDVMYDQGVRLVVSAAVPLDGLYVSGPMSVAFKRTRSRLEEMQSEDYLQRHKRLSTRS